VIKIFISGSYQTRKRSFAHGPDNRYKKNRIGVVGAGAWGTALAPGVLHWPNYLLIKGSLWIFGPLKQK